MLCCCFKILFILWLYQFAILEKFIFFKKLDTVLNKWQIFLGSCAPMEWAYIQRGIGQSIDIRTDRMETVLQIDDN